MNVALLAVDSDYPNLALMKLSAYHKAHGDTVKALRKEIKELEEENAELNHIIEKLTTKWKKNTKA